MADTPVRRLEVVDGTQRIRTLASFRANQLRLANLKILDKLNGYYFEDLSIPRQHKFLDTHLTIVVFDKTDEKIRLMMYEYIHE